MADDKGVNGWHYGNIANYYGKNPALPICNDCKFFLNEKGSYGSFGDYSYKCRADTGCAASKMGQGQMVDKCESFEQKKGDEKEKPKKSGKKNSLISFLIKWIIVSTIAFVAVPFIQNGGFEFEVIAAVAALGGALVGWILRFVLIKIFKATTTDWRDKLFSIFMPLIGAVCGVLIIPGLF